MIAVDEDALICDFAQCYHIYDYRQLPLKTAAVLAVGLEDDSRIKRKISGAPASINTMLMAQITDSLNTLVWMNSKDCKNTSKRPKSLVEAIIQPEKDERPMSFASGEEFENYRKALIRKGGYA